MTKSQSDTINHVIRIENNNDIDEDKDEGPSYRQIFNHKTNYNIQKMNIMAVFLKTKHKLYSTVIKN